MIYAKTDEEAARLKFEAVLEGCKLFNEAVGWEIMFRHLDQIAEESIALIHAIKVRQPESN